jgi:hypothetical protein
MKSKLVFIVSLVIGALLAAHAEEPKTAQKSKVVWHTITIVDYKPGTNETALAIIQKFESASKTAGTSSPDIHWLESGKYDLVITWKLKDGPADLKGKWSPDGEAWWNALVAQEGSEEAAAKLQAEYNELIESSVTSVARRAK